MSIEHANNLTECGTYRHAYVYFILCDNGDCLHIKIGASRSPLQRAMTLRTSCPTPMKIMGYAPVGTLRMAMRVEKNLHAKFAQWRLHGEWFAVPIGESSSFRQTIKSTIKYHSSPSVNSTIQIVDLEEYFKQLKARRRVYIERMNKIAVAEMTARRQSSRSV